MKGVIVPGENATEADWNRFYADLGRPAEATGYQFNKPADLPESFPYSPELEGKFREMAFRHGLNANQAQGLYEDYLKANLENYNQYQQSFSNNMEEMTNGLKKDWGDSYDSNLAVAQKAYQVFVPQGSEEAQALDQAMGDDPRLVKLFYNIGVRMGEATFIAGQPIATGGQEALQVQAKEIMVSEAYNDRFHPQHKEMVAKVNQIYQKLYPPPEEGT